jgi:predicted glutamine amidotransferase
MFTQESKFDSSIAKMFKELIASNTVRGYDSTGLIYEEAGEVNTYKKTVAGYDFVELPEVSRIIRDYEQSSYLIAHNRSATRGSISIGNAHPFEANRITGVHNGTLVNGQSLTKGNYGTDSEAIFNKLDQEDGDASKVISELNGSFVLIWHDYYDNNIHVIRNSERPYSFAKVKDKQIMLGASEYDMLKWVARRNNVELEKKFDPKEGYEYIFELDNVVKPRLKKQELRKPPAITYSNNHNRGNQSHGRTPQRVPLKYEFFLYDFDPNHTQHNKEGRVYGTAIGETNLGIPIVVNNVYEGEFKFRTWYSGTSSWLDHFTKDPAIQATTIKDLKKTVQKHEKESEQTQTTEKKADKTHNTFSVEAVKESKRQVKPIDKLICSSCEKELAEDITVIVDSSPVCITCAIRHNVEADMTIPRIH